MNTAKNQEQNRIAIGFKKAQLIHVSYGGTFSNNLYADSFEAILAPNFGISLDLTQNLRTKNKQENSYQDAKELAEGEIQRLELLQITEERTVGDLLKNAPHPLPVNWILEIRLNGIYSFSVTPEAKAFDLHLNVDRVLGSEGDF